MARLICSGSRGFHNDNDDDNVGMAAEFVPIVVVVVVVIVDDDDDGIILGNIWPIDSSETLNND